MFSVVGNDLPLIVTQLYSAVLWPAWVTPSHPLRPSGNCEVDPHPVAFVGPELRSRDLAVVTPGRDRLSGDQLPLDRFGVDGEDLHAASDLGLEANLAFALDRHGGHIALGRHHRLFSMTSPMSLGGVDVTTAGGHRGRGRACRRGGGWGRSAVVRQEGCGHDGHDHHQHQRGQEVRGAAALAPSLRDRPPRLLLPSGRS